MSVSAAVIARKYIQGFGRGKQNYKIDEEGGGGSLASLILSSKIQCIEKKPFSLTLFGEDVQHAFATSEAIGQCVSFCPRDLDKILKKGKGVVIGCILLVDISGFTKLSSALCTQGASGIDLLRKITDNSFAQFVECVYMYGGDVIEFAGDSVLCLFRSEHGDLTSSCVQAVRCGLHISKFRIDGTHTHVGISCGSISMSLIGGYHDQYTYLMNSKCLEVVGECLTLAGEQELVIDESVFNHVESMFNAGVVVDKDGKLFYRVSSERSNWQLMSLGRRKTETPPTTPANRPLSGLQTSNNSPITETENSFPMSPNQRKSSPLMGSYLSRPDFARAHLSLAEESAREIISCVPRPVLQGIITNSLSGLSEMRTVTTLFLKLDSFSFDEFTDHTSLDEFFINMQKCLFESGGMLRQFLIDDKGCVLIGLWGVPTASHAGNCSKALKCAVMMQNVSKDLGYRSSIGITTGSVYCGIVGTEYRRDYVAIGGSVNLAARLMCKAQGRILMDDNTFKRLPLNVTCYTSFTEHLEMKGIPPGSFFHCYWASTLPTSTADIFEDHILVFESYMRRDLNNFLEEIPSSPHESMGYEVPDTMSASGSILYPSGNRSPAVMTRKSFEESYIRFNETANSSFSSATKVLVIRGSSASGKTALMNYVIRRIIEPKVGIAVAPVYVCLNLDDDITPYSAIRKIVSAVLAWTQKLDGKSQWDYIQGILRDAFPKYGDSVLANQIYPQLRDALDFDWEWNVADEGNSCPLDFSDKSFHTMVAEFLYFLVSDGVPVVAIDDAHFMCSASWSVITSLCRMNSSAKIVLSIRVHESSSLVSPESVIKYAKENTTDVDTNLIEISHTATVRSMFKAAKSDTPSRHCSEFLALCRQMDLQNLFHIVLHPLSPKTIRRILEKEFAFDLIPQDTVETICAISRGNPFLLWKIIYFIKDSGSNNISELICNLKDNSFLASMLEKLPQSHCIVLKLASVIGEEFSKELLEAIVPPELQRQLCGALQNLENRGLLATLFEGFYSFTSSLIRKFVYDLIPPSDAKEIHRKTADQIENLYSNAGSLNHHRPSLCYHYSMSGSKSHRQFAVKYSCQLIVEYLDRREVESTIPFLAVAMKNAQARGEYHILKQLLSRAIDICTIHVSQDQLCNRDAISAYTLSKLVDMHMIASVYDSFHYSVQTKMSYLTSFFSLFRKAKNNQILPVDSNLHEPQGSPKSFSGSFRCDHLR